MLMILRIGAAAPERPCENSVPPGDRRIIPLEPVIKKYGAAQLRVSAPVRRIFHIVTAMTGFHTAWPYCGHGRSNPVGLCSNNWGAAFDNTESRGAGR